MPSVQKNSMVVDHSGRGIYEKENQKCRQISLWNIFSILFCSLSV